MQNRCLELKALRQMAHKMRRSGLASLEISGGNYRLRLKFTPVQQADPPLRTSMIAPPTAVTIVRSPMPGTVLLHYPPDGKPFSAPGAAVKKQDLLALVKVGLVYLPVRSPVDGIVETLAIGHGAGVGYDDELITVRDHAPIGLL
ncbi:acetyl-CoA carboxylase biotin carboxyl carrier protein subunit [Acerihabitans sp.]|uniref:acetyl-CoA carboxylase biotin carboxyl carrier protein n=1 Tax=Acerihabitans sp. TaxID=2811394 RepID=UPI002ED8171B